MLTLQNVQDIWAKFTVWLSNYFWTVDTFVQIVIVATSFIIAGIFYRMVKGGVTSAIDKAEMPISVKRTASNLYKLLFSLFALIIIFFMTMMTHSDLVGMSTSLNEGVMKLLLAWIISRVALQFVENGFIRNLLLFTILTITGLSVFGILDETSTTLDAVGFSFGKARFSALALIKGAMSIFILLYMALFASAFLERRVLRTKSLTRSTQVLTIKVMRVVLILFAVLIGVTSAGIDLSILTVFSGAVGLGVGFGLQKVISNLFSGMLLLVDKSITPGDIIELENGTFGWVNHMAARYTEVVTRNNKSYLIPNEDFITQRVIN
ncbi:MAG: mechanosensitive ion channel domain-containing protein, partial [Alphaproteobacteria bacterium]